MLSVVVKVAAVRATFTPLRVSFRSARSNPLTGSLKTIVIVLTASVRGSGLTAVTVAVGGVESTSNSLVVASNAVRPPVSVAQTTTS